MAKKCFLVITFLTILLLSGCNEDIIHLKSEPHKLLTVDENRESHSLSQNMSPSKRKYLNLKVGDQFGNVMITTSTGQQTKVCELQSINKLIFYVWDLCGDCIENYQTYLDIYNNYNSNDLTIIFLWTDKISEEMASLVTSGDAHYIQFDQTVRYNNWVPTYYILDENDTIIFKNIDIKELNNYLKNHYKSLK